MKVCKACGEEKRITDFYRHKAMKDGHLNKCKKCTRLHVRMHRQESERPRAYDKERAKTKDRKEHVRATVKKWRQRNPEKYKAQTSVGNAIRDGKIVRPEKCERCNSSGALHGHHSDYSKPLEVEWLCPRCHHSELRVYE